MKISDKGRALIEQFEGCSLTTYRCPANIPTIGYGSTGPSVHMGMCISQAEADKLLTQDLERFEDAVGHAAQPITQHQFDACVALAFNIGVKAFLGSTVLRKHLAGDHAGAAAAFGMWNKGGGRVLLGLTKRRAAEAALYLTP